MIAVAKQMAVSGRLIAAQRKSADVLVQAASVKGLKYSAKEALDAGGRLDPNSVVQDGRTVIAAGGSIRRGRMEPWMELWC